MERVEAIRPGRLSTRPRIEHRHALIVICLIPVALLVLLLGTGVWMSFRQFGEVTTYGLRAYVELYTDPFTYTTLLNTAMFTLVTVIVSLFFGISAAWLVERTDLRPKELPFTLMILGILTPGFLSAMGWVFLFNRRIGAVNVAMRNIPGLDWVSVDIASPIGMGFVQGLGLTPLAFIMISATYRAMQPALEEAGAIHGLGLLHRLTRITVPLTFPGVLAAGIYILTIGIAAFEVPAVIGMASRVFTFSTFLYTKVNPMEGLPRYDMAGAFGVMMIALALVLLWWYFRVLRESHRYAVVTGKAYRPKLVELGRWQVAAWAFLGLYFFLGQILPFLMLAWNALLQYPQVPSMEALKHVSLRNFQDIPWHILQQGARNTLMLMVAVPVLVLMLSVPLSWLVTRSGSRFRFVFDAFAFLPHAVPHILLAVSTAYLALHVLQPIVPVYGSIYLVLVVYVLMWISYATRNLNAGFMQLHKELDEAALVSGIPLFGVLRKILLPLLLPTLMNSGLWIALLVYRELTVISILASAESVTLPSMIWSIWYYGNFGQAAAAATLIIAAMVPLVALYWFFGRRAMAMGSEY